MIIIFLLQNQCSSSESAGTWKTVSSKKINDALSYLMAAAKEEVQERYKELISSVQEENECLVKSHEVLQSQLTKLKKEYEVKMEDLRNVKQECDYLKKYIEEQRADSVKSKSMVEAQEATSKCNEELKSKLVESQKNYYAMSATLKRTIDEKDAYIVRRISEMAKKYDQVDSSLKYEIRQKEALKLSLDSVTSKLKDTVEENEELKIDLKNLKDNHKAIYGAKLNHFLDENEAISKHNEKLQDEYTKLEAERDAIFVKLKQMTKEKESTAEGNEKLKLEIANIRKECDDLSANQTKLEETVADKQLALEEGIRLKDMFIDQAKALQCEKDKLKTQLDASHSQGELRKASEVAKDKTIADLKQQLQELTKLQNNTDAHNKPLKSKSAQTPRSFSGIKSVKCEKCNRVFVTSKKLKTHVKKVHRRERSHKCNCCDKTFYNSENLERHNKAKHLIEYM